MNFSLQVDESAVSGLKRIFRGQLHGARECLADDGRLTDEEIHQARKSIKRARATLRLLRPGLTRAEFKSTNRSLRDIARPLTQARDSKVLLDCLNSLRKHFQDIEDCLGVDELERGLQRQKLRSRKEVGSHTKAAAVLRSELRRLEAEAKKWNVEVDDWELLEPALERIYRNARREYARASKLQSDERLHEWRKQVKHFWYSMQILTPLRPGQVGEIADLAHKLANYLGDDHDLAVLNQYVLASESESSETLTALIVKRRGDLQDRAFAVGERMFDDQAKDFVRTLRSLYQAWRDHAAG